MGHDPREGDDRTHRVKAANAWDYVYGVTCLNDITARDIQNKETQYTRAKGFDTFAPFGPWIVPASQIPDPQAVKLKPDEVVWFSWITYKSRAQRDKINAKVMADPRLKSMMDMTTMPFDGKRMIYGGFSHLVTV